MEPYIEKIQEYLKQYSESIFPAMIFGCFIFGTLCVVIGIFFTQKSPVQAKTISTPSIPTFQKSTPDTAVTNKIMVDISGAVQKPGLYEFREGDRVSALIEKCGGFDKRVQKSFVAHTLNLSKKLRDEDKFYIPFQNESVSAGSFQTSASVSSNSSSNQSVNINSASSAELEQLAGIGSVRAEKIISGRPYKSLQELVIKKAVTQKILDSIKEKLTL